MRDEQDSFEVFRVKSGEVGFADAGRRLHEAFDRALRSGVLKSAKSLYLRPSGLKQDSYLCVEIRLVGVVDIQVFCDSRFMPVLRVSFQLVLVDDERVVLEKLLKGVIEFLVVHRVGPAAEAVVPLDAGGQRATGDIGGADIDVTMIAIVKYIGFRMERTILLIIKAKVHLIAELLMDQIKGGWLRDAEVIAGEDSYLGASSERPLQVLQKHLHTRFHQKRDDDVNAPGLGHAFGQLVVEVHSLVSVAGHDIRRGDFRELFVYFLRSIKFSHFSSPLTGLTSLVIHCSSRDSASIFFKNSLKSSLVKSVKYLPFRSPSKWPCLKEV